MISEKSFRENRRVTIGEVATETGINRMTLSKMINHKGYSTVTDNLDKLCVYFNCNVVDLLEYIPDEQA
jgi:putative transcriptional regulator